MVCKGTGCKAQASVEYISTFSIALMILAIAIAVVAYLAYANRGATQTGASCTISAQIYCIQVAVTNNGISSSTANVIFTNGLGVPMEFRPDSISFFPNSSDNSYTGTCFPSNAPSGSTVTCAAALSGYSPSVGAELESRFVLHYSECPKTGACLVVNTTGTSTLYVSP